MKGKTAIGGLLVMGIVIALATLGLVAGNWTQKLTVDGTVETSGLDARIDFKGSFDYEEFNGLKTVADCSGESSASGKGLSLIIENAYPNYWCDINWSVTNTGQMPIHVWIGDLIGGGPGVNIVSSCPPDAQLASGERLECVSFVSFKKDLEEKAEFFFDAQIDVTQFDKLP